MDIQEESSGIPRLLAQLPSIQVVSAALPCADYALGDALGVERKTAPDLGRSIVDGRLFRQMGALRCSFRRPLLLVEGLRDGAPACGVSWAAVRGAMINVCVSFGVPVLRTMDAGDSASLIATSARQLCAPLEIAYVRPGYRPMGWQKRALYILQGLPGVGPQRARALLERFGSVTAVLAADGSALAEVSGIGYSVARSIREAVGESAAIRSPSSIVGRTDS